MLLFSSFSSFLPKNNKNWIVRLVRRQIDFRFSVPFRRNTCMLSVSKCFFQSFRGKNTKSHTVLNPDVERNENQSITANPTTAVDVFIKLGLNSVCTVLFCFSPPPLVFLRSQYIAWSLSWFLFLHASDINHTSRISHSKKKNDQTFPATWILFWTRQEFIVLNNKSFKK